LIRWVSFLHAVCHAWQAVWTKAFMRQGVAMGSALGDGHGVVANTDAAGKVTLAWRR
jgi:hypothetical protein